jgi:DNA repair protein RAD5
MHNAHSGTPRERYIGAFGVTAWATRSGSGLISYGEFVSIDRAKREASMKKGKLGRSALQDIVVRFTNQRGEEVGRLENAAAAWISTLLDQKICRMVGSCVLTPERLKTGDTIYLQLRVYMLKGAFARENKLKPLDSNRQIGQFEAKESDEERRLRLRQVALVKLFEEINLQPTKANAQAAAANRKALLEAAELAEKKQPQTSPSSAKTTKNDGGSSPPSEEEEGQELEQDQLDSLYKKAQSFDFNTPEAEPAETFNMSLRKYQRQALHWMMSKEKDEQRDKSEQSMHPLWEEYTWPTENVDGKKLPLVSEQAHFYLNPYQGELSLNFPVQDQNCLGGILADGEVVFVY